VRSLPAFVFVLPALAQSPVPAPWILIYPAGDQQGLEWQRDDGLCRLVAGGDLSVSTSDVRLVQRLIKGGKLVRESRWALVDLKGERALEGAANPGSVDIQAAMASAGYRTSWERRENFLRENPEHGEAWLDLARCGLRLAQLRLAFLESQGVIFESRRRPGQRLGAGKRGVKGIEAEALADRVFKELAEGLEGLLRVPEWTQGRADFLRLAELRAASAGESPRVRAIAERMRPEMLEAWRREPARARRVLGEGWINLGLLLGKTEDPKVPLELVPPPAPPAPEVLRLVRFGKAEWWGCWEALRFAEPLVPWDPEELRWEFAAAVPPLLKQRQGWGDEPRWALFQGETLLASDLSCPSARSLADKLSMSGLTKLQRLEARILRDPTHLDARRERFALVLPRMSQPVLEWNLAEDARRAWIPLGFGPGAPWHPDPDLWANAALKVLPELEAALRRWPSQPELWKAWVSWAAFHPRHPSVLNMARQVEVWGPRGRWITALPVDVHEAVAEALRPQGGFEAMRQWFQEGREGLGPFPQNPADREAWVEAGKPIFHYLREALSGLRRETEAAALEREWSVYSRSVSLMRRSTHVDR